jgi:hypothetical protein
MKNGLAGNKVVIPMEAIPRRDRGVRVLGHLEAGSGANDPDSTNAQSRLKEGFVFIYLRV